MNQQYLIVKNTFDNYLFTEDKIFRRKYMDQGFNGIPTRDLRDTSAMLYQLSYEATLGSEVNLLSSYLPVRSEMMWSIYGIIHIFSGFFFPIA